MCHYFDDVVKVGNFDFNNFLFDEKSNENSYLNILIHDIWYKDFMGAKPLHVRPDKVDGFT